MTTIEELLHHAERCDRLAEICTDLTIAEKLRQLSGEYRELAAHQRSPFESRDHSQRRHNSACFET